MNGTNIFKSESLIFGFISITVISLLSLSGLVFVPIIKGRRRNRWMQVFIALAASSMSSDALLHILPQIFGVHDHVHHDHGHHHDDHGHHVHHHRDFNDFQTDANHSDHHHVHGHEQNPTDAIDSADHSMLFKMTAVIGAVYFLYILEFISASPIWKKKSKQKTIGNTTSPSQIAWTDCETWACHRSSENSCGHHGAVSGLADEPVVMFGLKSAAFVIIFGDAIHNFIDGIAVGASFVISNSAGVATSIAVACHELPHELGDFAVLIESGLSVPRAMLLNFLSSLTAYAGLIVGLAAISVDSAVEFLLAITAGMFLYVAWLDMLIHLKRESLARNDKWYVTLLLQNIGFISGFLIMFMIGWYEELLA